MPLYVLFIVEHLIAKQLTTASRCPPTPLSVGHAGTSVVSLQGIPSVTDVGHCGFKSCTRDTLLTIFRSFGSMTTADSCREDTVTTTFPVTIMQANANQHKLRGMQVCTSTCTKPHTDACICMHHTYQYRHGGCEYIHVLKCSYQLNLVNTRGGYISIKSHYISSNCHNISCYCIDFLNHK